MNFSVTAEAYDAFMGRFSRPLASSFAELLLPRPGDRFLDVGSGPGALTDELLSRGAIVTAIDPTPSFTNALDDRIPGIDVHVGRAEDLPFPDDAFDSSAAQLVVHFMSDPATGIREMARVTKRGGYIAACVWDFAGDRAPLQHYWQAAVDVDPATTTEAALVGSNDGDLTRLFEAAELADVTQAEVESTVRFEGFDEYWEPFTYGVGPAGIHCASLAPDHRDAVKNRCRQLLGAEPFVVRGVAWAAVGR